MASRIKVPKLAIAMTQGVLSEWLVDDGGTVAVGQPLYVLEADKVETEIESPVAGTLRHVGEAGTTYPVGEIIAEIT